MKEFINDSKKTMKNIGRNSFVPIGSAHFFDPETETGLDLDALTPFVNLHQWQIMNGKKLWKFNIAHIEVPAEGIMFMLSFCVAFGCFIAFTFHFTGCRCICFKLECT